MVALGPRTAARREPAKPLPGATWQGHVLDAGAITAELNRLWARFGGERRPKPVASGGEAAGEPEPVGVLTRASTLNLTTVARCRGDAERCEDAVFRLADLHPSRTTILLADPERARETEPGLDVRVALLEHAGEKGQPAVRFECVTVEVSAENESQLASIASPLLVFDLPDFLWWVGDRVDGSELFADLIEVSDRVLVDSSVFVDPAGEMRFLTELVTRGHGCPKLSDFAWARLAPWRQLVTQFFDQPATRPALDGLDEITISYGALGADRRSGLTAALLLAGWLGSRLGWRTPGELLPARDEPGGWRATLRAGGPGRRREVLLSLRPSEDPLAARSLDAVDLIAHGATAGSFRVERGDPLGLTTCSKTAAMPAVQRMVYATIPDDAELLAEELRDFGRDPVYEVALAFAAELTPEDGAGGAK